ncbi:glycosyltransferase [Rhodococcus sp. ARC_M5]|uniref:glycosyltransferase n=1 Tax=Rhodococcus sp. ARC_M5 TaxID=2928851 RepID=UPI001FB489E6|nr:glycosyltransferase [Rhodococcus sp. ARC_M5]MCJ0890604.1 glycosyltransferase [Rhodococcus sp. ARC_M5]
MKFVMPFNGSRGDVTPGLALGVELSDRGHEVVFGAPPNLLDFARTTTAECDPIRVVSFGPDTQRLLESELIRVRIKSRNPRTRLAALAELANYGWDRMTAELEQMAEGCDAVVTGSLGQEMAFNMAESAGSAFVALHYCPLRRNDVVPVVPGITLPGRLNRSMWALAESMRWKSMKTRENAQRVSLGMAPTGDSLPVRSERYGGVEIQAYESALFPGLAEQWGPLRPFVGFLGLSSGRFEADPTLEEWLQAGSAPVYFGFGSMPVPDPAALLRMIENVVERLGVRALVCAGWSNLVGADSVATRTNSSIKIVDSVDHGTVFPQCLAAVHHGGAGTTAATARAGLPTLVCWFSADQPYWGTALRRIGAGASTKFSTLTESVLQQAITDITTDRARQAARRLADVVAPTTTAVAAAADIAEAAARDR